MAAGVIELPTDLPLIAAPRRSAVAAIPSDLPPIAAAPDLPSDLPPIAPPASPAPAATPATPPSAPSTPTFAIAGDMAPGVNPPPSTVTAADVGGEMAGLGARTGKQLYQMGVVKTVKEFVGHAIPPGSSSDPMGGGNETIVTGKDAQGNWTYEPAVTPESLEQAQQAAGQRQEAVQSKIGLDIPPPKNLAEKGVDVGAGLATFIAKLAIAKKFIPADVTAAAPVLSEAAAWEGVNQVEGGPLGAGAVQGGTFGKIASIPVKTALGETGKVVAESAAGAGMAKLSGGDEVDVLVNALFPPAMKGIGALRAKYAAKLHEAKSVEDINRVVAEAKHEAPLPEDLPAVDQQAAHPAKATLPTPQAPPTSSPEITQRPGESPAPEQNAAPARAPGQRPLMRFLAADELPADLPALPKQVSQQQHDPRDLLAAKQEAEGRAQQTTLPPPPADAVPSPQPGVSETTEPAGAQPPATPPGNALAAKKTLPDLSDPLNNYRIPLDRHVDRLYTEQSAAHAQQLLDVIGSGWPMGETLWLSNNPDLATGQGKNRGVKIELAPEGITGVVSKSKPAWQMQYEQGGAEFLSGADRDQVYRDAARKVTVDPKQINPNDVMTKRLLKVVLPMMEERGWSKTKNADGTITYTHPTEAKAAEITDADLPARPPQQRPAVEPDEGVLTDAERKALIAPMEGTAPAPVEPPKPPAETGAAPTAGPERITSARKAMMAQDREALGLTELNSPERRSWETALDTARSKGIPDKAMDLAHEIKQTGRALSDVETAGMTEFGVTLKNKHAAVMDEIGALTDPAEIKLKAAEAERVQQDFDLLSEALKVSGTEKGRALASQKLTLNQDYQLVSVLNRAKAAKGAEVTPKERQSYEGLTKQLTEHTSRIAELEAKLKDRTAGDSLRQSRAKKYGKMSPAERAAELQGKYAKLKELLQAGCNN